MKNPYSEEEMDMWDRRHQRLSAELDANYVEYNDVWYSLKTGKRAYPKQLIADIGEAQMRVIGACWAWDEAHE